MNNSKKSIDFQLLPCFINIYKNSNYTYRNNVEIFVEVFLFSEEKITSIRVITFGKSHSTKDGNLLDVAK